MKRHALFLATGLAVASLGAAGLAVAQSGAPASAPSATAAGAATDAARPAKAERMQRHGKRHAGHPDPCGQRN